MHEKSELEEIAKKKQQQHKTAQNKTKRKKTENRVNFLTD